MAGSALPDARLEHLAAYLVELALCEYGSLHFLPSCVAAAAVLVAQFSLGVRVWSPTLKHYTRYGPPDLQVRGRQLDDNGEMGSQTGSACLRVPAVVSCWQMRVSSASSRKPTLPVLRCAAAGAHAAPPRGGGLPAGGPAGQQREVLQLQVQP